MHYYQRPDAGLGFDPTRTSLSGHAEEILFAKFGGERTRFETSFQRRSPGFEVNDMGFLRRADQQNWNTWFQMRFTKPRAFFQELYWNSNTWHYWTTSGLPTWPGPAGTAS